MVAGNAEYLIADFAQLFSVIFAIFKAACLSQGKGNLRPYIIRLMPVAIFCQVLIVRIYKEFFGEIGRAHV